MRFLTKHLVKLIESALRSGRYDLAGRVCRWAAVCLPLDAARHPVVAVEEPLAPGRPLADLPLVAHQHRMAFNDSSSRGRDPETVMSTLFRSPFGETARRAHRFDELAELVQAERQLTTLVDEIEQVGDAGVRTAALRNKVFSFIRQIKSQQGVDDPFLGDDANRANPFDLYRG